VLDESVDRFIYYKPWLYKDAARHRNDAIRLSGNAVAVVGIDIDVCYDGCTKGSIEYYTYAAVE
jgi:hypothetical protein